MKKLFGTRVEVNCPEDETVIKVEHLSKSFKLPTDRSSSLKGSIFSKIRGNKGFKKQKVLKDINFEIKRGEFLGIVGRNGSGKSTLLKILAGIYYPEKGKVTINGNLIPFIELGVGFNPDLTGRENVYLNGALLGFSHQEIDDMYDDIVKFAELEEFMNQKLKNFSSGMQVRLAFSIAIKARGDILVLDEVLAVGDEAFQNKCNQFFNKIKKDKTKTVVLVTHSMDNVRKFCDHAILIRDGVITIDGSPEDVANDYSLENTTRYTNDFNATSQRTSVVENLKITLKSPGIVNQKDAVKIQISYDTKEDIPTHVAITLWDIIRSQAIMNSNSKKTPTSGKKHHSITFKTSLNEINDANIRAYVSVRDQDNDILTYSQEDESPTFIFRRSDYPDPKNKTTNAILFNRGEYESHEKKSSQQ